ncbi:MULTISPECIES: ParB/RepB/Spo0J family partition protein [unclassified Acinetobacter]|uniref:ParB/RepB/Spo0J family partition protein n=1 Tax=unclassified Acinetobacter TaxID=196816 RepID=UPI0015D1989B|nr:MULTISPECIES: ParB/RepB/Spo0J family partition protein [unclassified Acinetobacter]UUS62531.1 ParB/RepB/Spo0J family partition protein [Acinetobacter sp. YH16056_T]
MVKGKQTENQTQAIASLDGLKNANFGNLVGKKASSNAKKENLLIDIALIEEDPLNVRTIFNELQLEQLAESIKENGVLTPISVRDNPEKPGHYIINNGARRFRASQLAQQEKIPAFVDNQHDELNQMIDNIQREDLSIIEIAEKLKKLLAVGDLSKSALAKRAGKPPAWVSKHLNALNMPPRLKLLYDLGQCNDLEAINAIVNRWEKNSADIQKWLESFEGSSKLITQAGTRKFFKTLDEKEEKQKSQQSDQVDIEELIAQNTSYESVEPNDTNDTTQVVSSDTSQNKPNAKVQKVSQDELTAAVESVVDSEDGIKPQCFDVDLTTNKHLISGTPTTESESVNVEFSQDDSTIAKASKVLSVLNNIDELKPVFKDEDRYASLRISLLKGTDEESKLLQSKAVSKLIRNLEALREEFPTLDIDIVF